MADKDFTSNKATKKTHKVAPTHKACSHRKTNPAPKSTSSITYHQNVFPIEEKHRETYDLIKWQQQNTLISLRH